MNVKYNTESYILKSKCTRYIAAMHLLTTTNIIQDTTCNNCIIVRREHQSYNACTRERCHTRMYYLSRHYASTRQPSKHKTTKHTADT